MRRIERTHAFKRDYRRVKAAPRHRELKRILAPLLQLLAVDAPLPARNVDHALAGSWNNFRECHVKPDLLLIYRKVGSDCLQLVRLGSHGELFDR